MFMAVFLILLWWGVLAVAMVYSPDPKDDFARGLQKVKLWFPGRWSNRIAAAIFCFAFLPAYISSSYPRFWFWLVIIVLCLLALTSYK